MYEALYGIQNDYRLAQSIIAPYFKKKVDFSNYLQIRLMDCDYFVDGNTILIGIKNPESQ